MRVAVISDIHVPYHDPDLVAEAFAHIESFKPDEVIVNGDLLDFHGISRYPAEPDTDALSDYQQAAALLADLRSRLDSGAKTIWMEGNHEYRLLEEAGAVPRYLRRVTHWSSIRGCEEFDNWTTRPYIKRADKRDHRRHLVDLGGIYSVGPMRVFHGWRHSKNANDIEPFEILNILGEPYCDQLCVRGHTHGVVPPTQLERTRDIEVPIWVCNTGCLCNPRRMRYTEKKNVHHWGAAVLLVEWDRDENWEAELLPLG